MDQQGAETSVGHFPAGEKWAFDGEVTKVFEDMLRRSIPQYEVMRQLVTEIASTYRKDGTSVVDLGASRGDAVAPLIDDNPGKNRYVLVEVSKPMSEVCRERFKGNQNVVVYDQDLRKGYPPVLDASVTISTLTLQFTPIEYRPQIIGDIFRSTLPGGAFILVEKILGGTPESHQLLTRMYHQTKFRSGYSWDEIERKKASLEGVLVPVTERWNEDMLRSAGFKTVEPFWRCLNFCGWLAVKAA